MKVGLMTTDFLDAWGGIASYCINLCKALSNRVEYHVFTTLPRNKDVKFNEEDIGLGVKIHPISRATNVPLTYLGYQLSLARQLPRLIKEYDLELVHFAGPLCVQMFMIGGHSVPHVLTYHSTLSGQRQGVVNSGRRFKDLHGSEKITVLFHPFLKLYESHNLAMIKNVIAISKSVRDELVRDYHYKGIITVIPPSIDTNIFQPGNSPFDGIAQKSNRRKVLFVGRFIAMKGIHFLIRAMPHVLRQHQDVVFVFAGAGDPKPYIRMLQEMDIPEDNFEFCHMSYQDMPQLYNSADMLVLPSLVEGFPLCILEAMACGLPVIASNVGDVAEVVRDDSTGFLIGKGDYNTLADRINLLLDSETLRQQMSKNARHMVTTNYSSEVMARKTWDIYQRCLD